MTNPGEDQAAQLAATVRELERQLAAARTIAAGLSSITRVGELVQQALDMSLEIADAEAGSVLLYDSDAGKLRFEYVVGEKADELMDTEIEPDQGIAGLVFQSGEIHISEDVSAEQAHLRDIGEKLGYTTQNMVAVPLKSSAGKPFGVIEVLNKRVGHFDENDVNLIDIMAAQIGVAIENARLQEEARLAEVVKFIGNISHDVKNMITPVRTGAETLQMIADEDYAQLDEALAGLKNLPQVADSVRQAVEGLREIYPELIDMILEGTEVVQQRMAEISAAVKGIVAEPHFEPTDIAAVGERVVNLLRSHAKSKQVVVALQITGDVPEATVDARQIYNAMYNLIYNAIDACDPGDSVALRLASAPADGPDQPAQIVIECADTGSGIPEEIRKKLFTEDAVSTKPMGTGLGTRIVANVVEVHSGSIEVESEVGVGTTIRVRIPVNRSQAA